MSSSEPIVNPSEPRSVSSVLVPPPRGHYSPAIVHGGLVYVSGLTPFPAGTDGHGDAGEQTSRTLGHLAAILDAAGSSLHLVLRTTAYVVDLDDWSLVNAAYAAAFGDHRPARAVVPVPALPSPNRIEIEAIAAVAAG